MIAAVEGLEIDRFQRPRLPQPQRVDMLAAPADNRRVIGDSGDNLDRMPDMRRGLVLAGRFGGAAKPDGVADAGALELPRISPRQPILGPLLLPAVLDGLAEQTEIIADAIAFGRHLDRGHALHKAGGEAPEAAIAERRVRLFLTQRVKIGAQHVQRLARRVDQPQIAQHIKQLAANEKFEGEIMHALAVVLPRLAPRLNPARRDAVAQCQRRGHVPVVRRGALRFLAGCLGQLGGDGSSQRRGILD